MESGWLIELEGSNGLCMGVSCRKTKWTTPTLATRFSREADAKLMAEVLMPKTKTFVSEHGWG